MEFNGRIIRQILLFSLVVMIIPMIIFPERFGTNLVKVSLVYLLYELIYYFVVSYILNRRTKLIQLVQASGICLIYRLVLGAVLGLLIVIMYPMNISVALTLSLSSYLPALLLHIVATPFILNSFFKEQFRVVPGERKNKTDEKPVSEPKTGGVTTFAISKDKGYAPTLAQEHNYNTERKDTKMKHSSYNPETITSVAAGSNVFDRAVRYIGEDGSVQLTAVLDNEGLLLGHFERGDIDPEEWAPFALSLVEKNNEVLKKLGYDTPEKIDYSFHDKKMTIAVEETYCLMVLSEKTANDILNIRIIQGLEMIRKYVAERYSLKLIGNAERTYV